MKFNQFYTLFFQSQWSNQPGSCIIFVNSLSLNSFDLTISDSLELSHNRLISRLPSLSSLFVSHSFIPLRASTHQGKLSPDRFACSAILRWSPILPDFVIAQIGFMRSFNILFTNRFNGSFLCKKIIVFPPFVSHSLNPPHASTHQGKLSRLIDSPVWSFANVGLDRF